MNRAVSPLLGTVLMAGVAVLLATVIGVGALGVAPFAEPADPVVVSVTASADGRIELVHEAGPPLDVTAHTFRLAVDDEPLAHQPPVPFFSAAGFKPGPTGPFNAAADQDWDPGERAVLRVADTNAPALERGSTLAVGIYRDGTPVVEVEARIE